MSDQNDLAERFEEQRSRLHHLAYRMLGSDAEADDAVQDAWLRLSRTRDDIENLGAWLTTVVSRLCLNVLRARAARAETELPQDSGYTGRLPDPIVEPADAIGDPEASAQLSDAVETALLLVLDRLSPAERVAFVLHDTFDVPFDQIGELLGRAPEAARQLASRARRRVRQDAYAHDAADASGGRRIVNAFYAAARDGDFDGLVSLLAPDIALRVDGGPSVTSIVRGSEQVASRAMSFASPDVTRRPMLIDGRPGWLVVLDGKNFSLMAFEVEDDHVVGIDVYTGDRLEGLELPA